MQGFCNCSYLPVASDDSDRVIDTGLLMLHDHWVVIRFLSMCKVLTSEHSSVGMTKQAIKIRFLSRRGGAVAAVTAVTMMLAVAVASATIPGPDGTIQGCYDAGSPPPIPLKIVDNPADCTGTLLPWNQTGPAGAAGAQGATGSAGASGIFETSPLVGSLGRMTTTRSYKFAGPTAVVVTLAGQRVTGTTVAALGLRGGRSRVIDSGLCYQPLAGGAVSNFVGSRVMSHVVSSGSPQQYSAAASVAPGAGSWRAGFCVRNGHRGTTSVAMSGGGSLNGWIMVTN